MRSLLVAVCLGAGASISGVFVVACSSDNLAGPGPVADAGIGDVVVEAGEAEAGLEQDPNVYPADHQPIPVLTNPGKGPVLASPKVVTITFAGDSFRDRYRAFDDEILTTPWWTAAIGGIGVGPGSSGGHVELPAPWMPSGHKVIQDGDVQAMLQDGITLGTIPPPTPGTIYNFYFPKNATIQVGGAASCDAFCGYHSDATVLVPVPGEGGAPEAGTTDGGDAGTPEAGPPMGTPVDVSYAITATCDLGICWSDDAFQQMTGTASHELAEAASDPYPNSQGAYSLYDDDSWRPPGVYSTGGAPENGDACIGLHWTEGNYWVQRIWSNAAAMRSDQPCQPVPAGAIYFAAAVRTLKQNINGHLGYGYLVVKRGTTATAVVNVFSNAALQHDMLLYAGAPKQNQSDPSDLDMVHDEITTSLSRLAAHNGNAVILSVSVPDDATTGDFRMVVRAVYETDYNDWPLIIHVK